MEPIQNVPDILDQYLISEDGLVYSIIKRKYLKGQLNSSAYQMYRLKLVTGDFKWFMAHRLVTLTYPELKNIYKPSIKIKLLTSNGKKKKVEIYQWKKHLKTYESIGLLCSDMDWSRRKFNRILSGENIKLSKQFTFKFIYDKID